MRMVPHSLLGKPSFAGSQSRRPVTWYGKNKYALAQINLCCKSGGTGIRPLQVGSTDEVYQGFPIKAEAFLQVFI